MVRSFAAAIALILSTSACAARSAPAVSEAELRETISVIASDAFEGRRPGTPGGARTEAWIADAFSAAGLSPAGDDGGWRQAVPLVTRTPEQATLGPVTADQLVVLGLEQDLSLVAPVVRAGAADMKGAIVLAPMPAGAQGWRRLDGAVAPLAAGGAAAVIFIVPGGAEGWAKARAAFAPRTGLPGDAPAIPVGILSEAAAARLSGTTPQPLVARTALAPIASANIVGRVKGRLPSAGAVVLMAHWDHLGICRPEGAADRICNGANDNASGVAMLVSVARRLAESRRPARDIYLVATTAEEMGLLGAGWFADHAPSRIVAALNLDTAAIAPAGKAAAIIGRGRWPALDRVVDATVLKAGRRVDADQEANVMLERQDGWALARKNIPSVMVAGAFSDMDLLNAFLRANYHGPGDEVENLPSLAGAAEDATLHVALARALADPKIYPAPAPTASTQDK